MPLVPRFLRPAPPRVDDGWSPADPIRVRRFTAEAVRKVSAEVRALPDPTPPKDEWDDVAFAPDSEPQASPEKTEAPGDVPASPSKTPVEAEIIVAAPAELAAPQPARFTAAHAGLPDPYAEKLRRSQAKERFICDTLQLARLCWRKTCRRAGACRGDPGMCRFINGDPVPGEAHEWAELLAEADENGEPREALEADYPDEACAFRCWVAALDARVRR
jgi:hypothetical protein